MSPPWNVVVTTESGRRRFRAALEGLEFWTVPFKGVCVGRVDDMPAFARAIPVERSFARRGLAGKLPSELIEREVADHVFSLAAAHGVELHTSFSDPDNGLAAETVGDECGVALLPRALRERFAFVATR